MTILWSSTQIAIYLSDQTCTKHDYFWPALTHSIPMFSNDHFLAHSVSFFFPHTTLLLYSLIARPNHYFSRAQTINPQSSNPLLLARPYYYLSRAPNIISRGSELSDSLVIIILNVTLTCANILRANLVCANLVRTNPSCTYVRHKIHRPRQNLKCFYTQMFLYPNI